MNFYLLEHFNVGFFKCTLYGLITTLKLFEMYFHLLVVAGLVAILALFDVLEAVGLVQGQLESIDVF